MIILLNDANKSKKEDRKMNEEFTNAMRDQVLSLPELMREQYKDLEPKTRCVLTTPEIFDIQHIILVGLGDSYAACLSMKPIFETLTGKRTECLNALDLSRFYEKRFLGGAPHDPLVIAVSNSGKVARMGEALMRVRKYGAFVLGVTGNQAILAQNSDRVLKLDIPKFASAPGTRSYMVSVMSLYLLAIRIGEVRGKYTMDTAKSYRKDILKMADELERMLPEMDAHVLDLAKRWKDMHHFDFVGAGFDYAAAWFGKAKAFEATGDFATDTNMEEWLHLNFFMKNISELATMMIANTKNPALSRCKETIKYANELGRPMVVITDGGKDDFGVDTEYIQIPRSDYPYAFPLTEFVPICLLFGYFMAMRDERAGRGCTGPWIISKDAACVRNSEIVIR